MTHGAAGLACGLTAAGFQSLSYLFSRRFMARHPGGPLALFAISQFQLGLMGLALLPFLWRHPIPSFAHLIFPLLGTSLFYLLGQWFLITALKKVEASQFAPLLGFKIPILALASALLLSHPLPPVAWLAIALAVAAGFIISPPGKMGSARTLLLAGGCAVGYAGSDFSIPFLVKACEPLGPHPVMTSVALSYLVAGWVGWLLLLSGKVGRRRELFALPLQTEVFPYSLAWLLAMIFLFACFYFIGVVFGNMVQSTRALQSVLMAALVTRAGWLHLEDVRKPGVWWQRLGGAALMTLSISLYFMGTMTH